MNSSAQRALEVLEIVSTSPAPVGVTAVAQRAGIPPGTAYRSLDALERRGYLERFQSSTQYVPGETMRRLRQSLFARFHVRDVCMPYMHQLAFASGETITLTVAVGWYGVTVAVTEGANAGTGSALGSIVPLADSFAARAILASYPPELLERYQRWHTAHGFVAPGNNSSAALAFPLRSGDRAIAALAILGAASDSTDERAAARLARCRETVAMIERRIAERPEFFRNPFEYIDPDSIDLPLLANRPSA